VTIQGKGAARAAMPASPGLLAIRRSRAARAAAGGWGAHTRRHAVQPTRFTRPVCASMVKRAITEPSGVAMPKPIAPSAAGATSTTFQL